MSPLVLLHMAKRADLEVPLPLRICRLASKGRWTSNERSSRHEGPVSKRRLEAAVSAIITRTPPLPVLRIMVVDDEPLARSLLVRLCRSLDDVEVVAESESGNTALEAARTLQPDLMLLDVDLPDMSGFELMRALQCGSPPASIIVATSAEHALSAFDAGAIDFLIKPVRAARFNEAMRRARGRSEAAHNGLPRAAPHTAWTPASESNVPERPRLLAAERERRLYLLDPEKVDYIEAYGNYVRIWSGAVAYISRECVKELAILLASSGFVRIQRSKLVNLRAVSYIERPGHGLFVFALSCGTRLESTPTYRAGILRALYPADFSRRWATQGAAVY
jgi:two-component system LytT family response regulator